MNFNLFSLSLLLGGVILITAGAMRQDPAYVVKQTLQGKKLEMGASYGSVAGQFLKKGPDGTFVPDSTTTPGATIVPASVTPAGILPYAV